MTGRRRRGQSTVARQVGQFAAVGVVALALVGVGTAVASQRAGEREAITDARALAVTKAQGVVGPAVSDALIAGDPAAQAQLDQIVRHGVLDQSIVRVKIWDAAGRIVYSDEPLLIGTTYQLGPDELGSLRSGAIEAEISDLAKPENRYERSFEKLLEVYLPIYTSSDTPLLFEAYFRYDAVSTSGSRAWRSFAPISIGALVLLELVQIPLAWSLARRLQQRLREREGLLQRALDASEVERRRIASDLHDGVVQDLAGLAYAFSGAARKTDAPAEAQLFESSAEHVRESIKALRSLLVEIYPPNLEEEGLPSSLADLLARAQPRGVTPHLDTSELEKPLPAPVAQLLYRAAQESLRNVLQHAEARSVSMSVATPDGVAVLEVNDDGHGFELNGATVVASSGHVGLRALSGLVADAGGTMRIRSSPGQGTTVHVEVPLS